jgi:hypothetical protein
MASLYRSAAFLSTQSAPGSLLAATTILLISKGFCRSFLDRLAKLPGRVKAVQARGGLPRCGIDPLIGRRPRSNSW